MSLNYWIHISLFYY